MKQQKLGFSVNVNFIGNSTWQNLLFLNCLKVKTPGGQRFRKIFGHFSSAVVAYSVSRYWR
jgi:hypothetical protein